MAKIENNIKDIMKSLAWIKREIKKTNEFINLLWELMHEEHIIIIY